MEDTELTLHQLHCRYARLRGLDFKQAAGLWRELEPRKLSRLAHMDALFARLDEIALPSDLSIPEATIDSADEGREIVEELHRRSRNPALAACRLEIDGFECQWCRFRAPKVVSGADGSVDVKQHVVEIHHIKPLQDGERTTRLEDLVTLCPTCHRLLHAIGSALRRSELPPDFLGLAADNV
jgi:predicted HNH restriction endonuclease